MADFWIKVEKGTPDKPEILEIASILNISDPDTVTGKLIRVWSWFDSNSENGHAPSVTNVLIDRMTGVTGFTDSLVTVGWLTLSEDGSYMMSNFDRHIGKGAKKRASDAERKRKSRAASEQCHKKSVTENGLDKSREDKSKDNDHAERDQMILESFEFWWQDYPSKLTKKKALQKWQTMTKKMGEDSVVDLTNKIVADITNRKSALESGEPWAFGFDRLHPTTYLNNERWNDEL